MDWDKLQYFLFVARHGTLARAGAALHVDATTVSRRVSALETALGQTLFERAPTGFVLTAAGRALVPHAEAMAAAAARIHRRDEETGLSGQLRVSVSEGFGNSFIAPRLGRFVAAHPGRTALADWHDAIAPHLDLLAPDHIHPGSAGGRIYASCVATALGRLDGAD